MRRGEVWTLHDEGYASKARPAVIVQSDRHASFGSVILCLLTSFESEAIETRVKIEPTATNGLLRDSYVMTDKIVTVDRALPGERIGELSAAEMEGVSEQLRAMLDL